MYPEGKSLVVERIGQPAWDTLLPAVQHFLATALLHLDEQGHAPQLDYAPISLELVKALEVELGAVFESYSDTLNAAAPAHNTDDRDESNLAAFLAKTPGKKPPTLGRMSYFLRPPKEGASEMILSLHAYLRSLRNVEFLTGDKFLKQGLQRVIHKYRNGGAHDSPITEDVCRACLLELLGTPGQPVTSHGSPPGGLRPAEIRRAASVLDVRRFGDKEDSGSAGRHLNPAVQSA
jgi:hypothetical protein